MVGVVVFFFGVDFFWQCALVTAPVFDLPSLCQEHTVLVLQAVSSRPLHGEGVAAAAFVSVVAAGVAVVVAGFVSAGLAGVVAGVADLVSAGFASWA